MKTLTLKLTGPLQSYGDEASFSRRTSGDYPSKSAVIGMIAAALGYRRDDARITDLNALKFAVRCDQPGEVLTDFQTVEWKPGTRKITYRNYLQDAVFVAAVASDDADEIDRIETALHHPKFQLFLGRRANVPAGVLKTETFDGTNPVEVLSNELPWQAAKWYQRRHPNDPKVNVAIIADVELLSAAEQAKGQDWLVKDQVVSFDQRDRRHSYRAVNQTMAELANLWYRGSKDETEHDAFGALKEG